MHQGLQKTPLLFSVMTQFCSADTINTFTFTIIHYILGFRVHFKRLIIISFRFNTPCDFSCMMTWSHLVQELPFKTRY